MNNARQAAEQQLPTELQLVRWLRAWQSSPNETGLGNPEAKQAIYGLLESFISTSLRFGPRYLSEWWSDGLVLLEAAAEGVGRVKLLGVTRIMSKGLAPFEIDFELDQQTKTQFARIAFRIGALDERRQPVTLSPTQDPWRILEVRPRHDCEWAMAVELTPCEAAKSTDAPI